MQIDEALSHYLIQLEADGRSHHTIGQARRHVRLLETWLREAREPLDVDKLRHETLARFLASQTVRCRADGKPRKATSANALRSSIRCFCAYVHGAGYSSADPGKLIRRARVGPTPPKALSKEEQERLVAVLDQAQTVAEKRDRVLFRLMLATGIRIGSALALDVEDVDFERSELRLRQLKGGGEQSVSVPPVELEMLREHCDGRQGPLFANGRGTRVSSRHVQRRLTVRAQWAGIRHLSPHGLRHTFGNKLYAATNDPILVGRALGHSLVSSTAIYARPAEARLREAQSSVSAST